VQRWTDRISELHLTLPDIAPALGAYVPAVRSGSLVFTSGQLPLVNGALSTTGKLGAEVSVEDAAALARISTLNALAAIDALVGLDSVSRIVRVGGFVASDPGFTRQAAVIDGASGLLHDIFGQSGIHARAAVGVAALPLDSPVEVELLVELDH
jgi:enamine deaminase RidA (YjgF/YER057c/UK114 family)